MLRGQRDWDREMGSARLQINEFFFGSHVPPVLVSGLLG